MKTIAVIVTYGNRFFFLEKVVNAANNEGVSEIWIVDNASSVESKTQINILIHSFENIRLFTNELNLGTAGAYSLILEYAFKLDDEFFFWFLDDDNFPCKGSLNALHEAYSLLSRNFNQPVLYCYRGNHWKDDLLAVSTGTIKGPIPNGFCGFDIISYIGNKLSKKVTHDSADEIKFPIIKVEYGPYGGLFTPIVNLKKIGLPKKEFFVYADDHEYTIRFSKIGVKQFLIYSSEIEDLDMSYKEGEGIFSPNISLSKLFYSFRNTTYFYNQLKTHNFIYQLNRISFYLIISYWSLFKILKSPKFIYNRLKFLFIAVRLGEKGVLKNYS